MNANPSSAKPGTGQRVFVTIAAGLGVAALAGGAFVLSFDDLRTLALHGGAPPRYARLYPAMYDAVVVVVMLSLLLATAAGWWARRVRELLLLLLLGGAAAAGVQRSLVGYAALPIDAVKAGVAVAPWVILLIAIWLWISMFKHARRALAGRAGRGAGPAAPEVPAPRAPAPEAPAPEAPAPRAPASDVAAPGVAAPPAPTPVPPVAPQATPAAPTHPASPHVPAGRTGLRPVGPPPLERYAASTPAASHGEPPSGEATPGTGGSSAPVPGQARTTATTATTATAAKPAGGVDDDTGHSDAPGDSVGEPADDPGGNGHSATTGTAEAAASVADSAASNAKDAGTYVDPDGETREGVPDPAEGDEAADERLPGEPADTFPGTPPSSTFRSSPTRPED